MIDFRDIREEVKAYAEEVSPNRYDANNLYAFIMDKIFELEEDDDKNGTNNLEDMLERHDIEWFAKEYGLV